MLLFSADQNTHILVDAGIQITENEVFNGARTGWLGKRFFEVDG